MSGERKSFASELGLNLGPRGWVGNIREGKQEMRTCPGRENGIQVILIKMYLCAADFVF